MTTATKLLSMFSFTLCIAQTACTREYIILRAAYQNDNDARANVGRTLRNRIEPVQLLDANQVFKTDVSIPAQLFAGNDKIKKEINATLLAQVKASINKVCTVNGQIGALDISKTSNEIVTYESVISPIVSAWRPETAGGCCNVDGTVNNACSKKSAVAIAIYKTTVSFKSDLRIGIPVNAEVQCLGDNTANVAGSVKVSVGVNNSRTVDSNGWNIVQVWTLKQVCENLRSNWNAPVLTPHT